MQFRLARIGIVHAGARIYQDAAAQVGFFLKTLDEHAVGAAVQLPVQVTHGFTGIVGSVFSEFYREAVVRTPVQAIDEAFHHLAGQQVEVPEILYFTQQHGANLGRKTQRSLALQEAYAGLTSAALALANDQQL